MFYTYAHYKPQGGLFYIGKGKRRRAFAMDTRNSHWQNVVNKYGKPHVELLAGWDTEEEALDHERLLIACFKDMGMELTNKTDGGEGTSGYKHTEEAKLKNRLAHMGRTPWNKGLKGVMIAWNKGLPMSEEQRIKLRNAKLGKVGNRKGKTNSPEHRAKISFANKGKITATVDSINKIKLANTGRKHIQATCIHCRTTGGVTGMARWHFDNCRLKEIK